MLHENENTEEEYETLDPYIRRSLEGSVEVISYQDYEETAPVELDTQYKSDNLQFTVDKLREKRHNFEPLEDEPVYEQFLTPLYAITAFFAAMLIFGPLLVRKGPNRGIVQASIMLSAFCMWIFWFTIYFGQMNPLMGPRLENTTVAWIAYKLGNALSTNNTTLLI